MMRRLILTGVAAMLLAGAMPVHAEPAMIPPVEGSSDRTIAPEAALHESLLAFLEREAIPHGGLYWENGTFVVNVVRLNDEIEAMFAQAFEPSAYRLREVDYTLQELEEAQTKLNEQGLYSKAGIFASVVDVYTNRLLLTLFSGTAEAAKPMIEAVIDPELLVYETVEEGPVPMIGDADDQPAPAKPDVTGKIRKTFQAVNPGKDPHRKVVGSIVLDSNDKAVVVYVTSNTKLARNVNGKEIAVDWTDIKAGANADVYLQGPYILKYPLTADAIKLVVS